MDKNNRNENVSLLLNDLCARLPYDVIVTDRNGTHRLVPGNTEFQQQFHSNEIIVKPHLRPLGTMTADEIYDLASCVLGGIPQDIDVEDRTCHVVLKDWSADLVLDFDVDDTVNGFHGLKGFQWLDKNMFDYRGLSKLNLSIPINKAGNILEK
ncbi:MAG: hypothetical protein VZR36_06390 [Prevotella sp.]|nr:hypothetical protein [Prevotella sp.]